MSKKESQRRRRTLEQMISALEAQIDAIKRREAKKVDPALRHVRAALNALGKARDAAEDARTRRSIEDAHATLGALVGEDGAVARRTRRSPSEIADLSVSLLAYLRAIPGQRGEEIAAALGTDTKTIRPVMKHLIADGKVTTQGQRRGMTYAAV